MSSSLNSTLSSNSASNPGAVDAAGTLDADAWTQLIPDISDSGPVMAFNTGNTDGSFYNTWPTVSGPANGWFLIQWLHNQDLNPANMVVNDTSITDPTYGHPEYTFTTPDGEEELNVYNSNGSYYYDIRESGGLFQGAGANIILQTEVTQQDATFNHQMNFSLDAKMSEATVGTIPGQNAGVPTVICGIGFEISFNAVGSANYDASLPTYTVMFQLPISQTPNVSAFLYPQNYGLQLGAGAAALQNVSGEVVNGEEQLALQADGGALHSLSYNLNYYLEAMLAQSTYTDPTTGAVGALPSTYTDLSRWSVSGAYIGTETTNQDPNVVGNASIGLMVGNVNFSIDQQSNLQYSAPTINNHTPTVIQPAAGPAPTTLYAQGPATPTPTVSTVNVSSSGMADVQGSGVTGDVIVLFDGAATVGSAVVNAQGDWSVSSTGTLGEGTHSFSALQYSTLGNAGSASAVVDYVVAPSAPAITGVAPGSNTSGTVAGTGSPGDTIILSDGAVTIGSASVSATGTWDVQSENLLSTKSHIFSAVEEDASGNLSSASPSFAYSVPTAPVITTPLVTPDDLKGASTILGGGGSVSMVKPQNPSYISGGATAETILGGTGQIDYQNSGAADTFVAGSGASTINTGAGGGVYSATTAPTLIEVGSGAATISAAGTGVCDSIFGGGNSLYFLNSSQAVYVNQSTDGTPTVVGGVGAATVYGGTSNGLYFMDDQSIFVGGSGQSTVRGSGELFGGSGNNEIIASTGNTTLVGGSSSSLMFGQAGNVMVGGSGSDTMIAGGGSEQFFTGSGSLDAWLGNGTTTAVLQSGTGSLNCQGGSTTFIAINGQGGGNYTINSFVEGSDQVVASGFTAGQVSAAISSQMSGGGNSTLALGDGTRITFVGLSNVTSSDIHFS
jgi:hypothetical protein